MFRTAAALLAKKTAIVAITGVTLIGGATFALADNHEASSDKSAEEVTETPIVADEATTACPPPADEDSGGTGDTGDTDDTTGDADDTTGDAETGGDASTQSSDCEGAAGNDTAIDAPTNVEDGADPDGATGEDDGDLQEPELAEEEVAEDNHGAAVSRAAKDCKTDLQGAKNQGQCVREVAQSDDGKKAADASDGTETGTSDKDTTSDETVAEPKTEKTPKGKPAHAGGKGNGKGPKG